MEKEKTTSEESRQFFAAFRAVSIVHVVWDVLFVVLCRVFYCLLFVSCGMSSSRFSEFGVVLPADARGGAGAQRLLFLLYSSQA